MSMLDERAAAIIPSAVVNVAVHVVLHVALLLLAHALRLVRLWTRGERAPGQCSVSAQQTPEVDVGPLSAEMSSGPCTTADLPMMRGAVYSDFASDMKEQNNMTFVNSVCQHIGRDRPTVALVLDAEEMRTTRALCNRRGSINVHAVHVPQMDAAAVRAMLRKGLPPRARVMPGTMQDWLCGQAVRGVTYNALYLDYMCTVTGSRQSGIYPLQDMSDALERHVDRSGKPVVLCCTFSARQLRGVFEDRTCAEHQVVQDYLVPLWAYHRFCVRSLQSRTYHRERRSMSMIFVCAVLSYDPHHAGPDSPEAQFVLSTDGRRYDGYPAPVQPR